MNQLNKLIEQYERENPEKKVNSETGWTNGFVNFLASRPTCGKEQRKFLDEVEKDGWMYGDGKEMRLLGATSFIQHDFDCDLRKVLQGE